MIDIRVAYEGDLQCQAVHGPSGVTLHTDAPVDNGGRGESFSPTDLVATALATCMATVIGIVAVRKELDIRGLTVRVEKHMSADAPRRIVRLPIEIRVPLPPGHPDRDLFEATARGCPVHQSVHPDIDKPILWHWEG